MSACAGTQAEKNRETVFAMARNRRAYFAPTARERCLEQIAPL